MIGMNGLLETFLPEDGNALSTFPRRAAPRPVPLHRKAGLLARFAHARQGVFGRPDGPSQGGCAAPPLCARLPATHGTGSEMSDLGGKGDPRAKTHADLGGAELMRAGLEYLDQGIAIYDKDLRLVEFNRAFVEIFEFPPDQVRAGMRVEDLIRHTGGRGNLGTADTEGYVQDVLQRIRKPSGEWYEHVHRTEKILHVRRSPLPGGGVISIFTDITERKRVEDDLRQKAKIIDHIHDSVVSTDLDGYVTSWNKGAERLFGYAANEAMGRHIAFVYPEEEHAFLLDQIIAPLKEQGNHEVEVRMLRKSGEDFFARLSLSLLHDDAGVAVGMIGYTMDITRRKRAEEALRMVLGELEQRVEERTRELSDEIAERHRIEDELRESRRMLSAVIDSVPAMINAKDRDRRYVFMNRYQAEVYGVEPAEAMGRTASELLGGEYGERTEIVDGMVLSTGESFFNYEESYFDAGGERRDWLTTKVPLGDGDGGVANVVTVAIDITQRKRAEKRLVRAKEEAATASQAKSEFLARMSHDMRTPLNAIIGFSEIVAGEMFGTVGNEQYRQYAQDIHDSGVLLLNLINDVLDLSKIEAGKFEIAEESVDIAAIIAAAARPAGFQAKAANVRLTVDVASDLPMLFCDWRAVRQILDNLLSNAIKFTPAGGEVALTAAIDDNGRMVMVVADSGVGIAPKDIDRVLEPFEQVDGAISSPHEGTGLGLHLGRRLTELHGGTLDIASAIGVGTTVTVCFPRDRVGG
jgi:two-component system, cell cycle sensor histidine kinase PleC